MWPFLKNYIATLRPKQWTKNILIFAAPLFAIRQLNPQMVLQSVYAFGLFCLLSGSVYVFNDFFDREKDKRHVKKKHRPMAAGRLNPHLALIVTMFLLILVFGLSFLIGPGLLGLFVLYWVLNLLYSFKLKNVVLIDVMIIAIGFVIRAISGGVAVHVPFTPWFLLCVMLLALFLAISKRRAELTTVSITGEDTRDVLKKYTKELLNQFISIVTTLSIMSYGLFTFTSGHTVYLMLTIPFVIYGIFRYLYLIETKDEGEAPERLLIEDKPILITVVCYAVSVAVILSFFD